MNNNSDLDEANTIRDQISYGMGMTSERHQEILFDIGNKYCELIQKHETGVMHELSMYEYVRDTYKNNIAEMYCASNVVGRIRADKFLLSVFMMKYAMKKHD